jgi:hypothetical protein
MTWYVIKAQVQGKRVKSGCTSVWLALVQSCIESKEQCNVWCLSLLTTLHIALPLLPTSALTRINLQWSHMLNVVEAVGLHESAVNTSLVEFVEEERGYRVIYCNIP